MKVWIRSIFLIFGLLIGSTEDSRSGVWQSAPENNLSHYFKNDGVDAELYLNGVVVELTKFQLTDPQNKIVIIFNHGTYRWRDSQDCHPNNSGIVIRRLTGIQINKKTVTSFHLCSFSAGTFRGDLTPIRANEIQLAVSYFLRLGVKAGDIFIFGQSRGGWSTLYFGAKNKNKKLGGYVVFAPAICGFRGSGCPVVVDEHITLFKSARIDGILYSHPEDTYFTPSDHKFANGVPGLKLRTGFCKELKGRRAHSFYRHYCSKQLVHEIKEFMHKRGQPSLQ